MKLKAISVTAKAGAAVYDPDEIAAVVTEATAGGFLPSAEAELEVHLRALGNVRRPRLGVPQVRRHRPRRGSRLVWEQVFALAT